MGLFDLFSNDTAERAAEERNAGLQKGYDALSTTYGQGRDALQTGANQASSLWQNYGTQANQMYGAGANAYGDYAGANGVDGMARATDAFKNSGQYGVYGIGLQEGLQALTRARAAGGNLVSGNTDTDAIKYAQDQATKAYGQYGAGLSPYLQLQGQGQLASTAGQANAATGLASGLNASYQGQGGAANANYTGQGASTAAATMNNYNVGANTLNAITGVGSWLSGGGPTNAIKNTKSLFSAFGE